MNDEGKCIAVSENSADDGINVELQTYTGADNQLWKLVQDGAFTALFQNAQQTRLVLMYLNGVPKVVAT